MTRIDPKFLQALSDAYAWANATGWPTEVQDMAITAEVVQRLAGQDVNLTQEIFKALPDRRDGEGRKHRAVLCRVTARLAGVLDPPTKES